MASYEGRPVSGVWAWLGWVWRVYLSLQRDALRMNLAYQLAVVFVIGLGWVLANPALIGLAVLVWLLMPFAFINRIRRSFLKRQAMPAGKQARR